MMVMSRIMRSIEATFDGQAFWPKEPVGLAPNTTVRLTVEQPEPNEPALSASFIDVARSLKLDGPPDWSANLDAYLYDGTINNRAGVIQG